VLDALLLDLTMPKPDGWDVLEFIRKTVPRMFVRTAILTGMCYDRNVARTLQDKGITHLFKPFLVDSLRKTVCGLLPGAELPLSVWSKMRQPKLFRSVVPDPPRRASYERPAPRSYHRLVW
jgi:DNA-binding response OmpR family regulator